MNAQQKCKQCGNPLPPLAKKDGDPYCSTSCCKQAYKVRVHGWGRTLTWREHHEPT